MNEKPCKPIPCPDYCCPEPEPCPPDCEQQCYEAYRRCMEQCSGPDSKKAENSGTGDFNGSVSNGGDPVSNDIYPGTALRWGSAGTDVVNMQNRLNRLSNVYTAINNQTVDGRFGQNMYNAVVRFQRQHGLAPDGVIGRQTWNRIVTVDNAQTGGDFVSVTTPYPGYVLTRGATGNNVRFIQSYMSAVPGLTPVAIDGKFGANTEQLVRSFQQRYNLTVDGKVGPATWAAMVRVFNSVN